MVEIRYLSTNAVVVYKDYGVPSQPDPSGDLDALTATSELLKARGESSELWLINRLDRGVAGLMIFARSKCSAADLSALVRDRQIIKEYFAVVEGKTESGTMLDFLYKDSRTSKAYVVSRERSGVKRASLAYETIETVVTESGEMSLVKISLETGRFHQIRAQFSSRNHPIVGDKKYGSRINMRGGIALMSCRLSASVMGESIDIKAYPAIDKLPWSVFDLNKILGE